MNQTSLVGTGWNQTPNEGTLCKRIYVPTLMVWCTAGLPLPARPAPHAAHRDVSAAARRAVPERPRPLPQARRILLPRLPGRDRTRLPRQVRRGPAVRHSLRHLVAAHQEPRQPQVHAQSGELFPVIISCRYGCMLYGQISARRSCGFSNCSVVPRDRFKHATTMLAAKVIHRGQKYYSCRPWRAS